MLNTKLKFLRYSQVDPRNPVAEYETVKMEDEILVSFALNPIVKLPNGVYLEAINYDMTETGFFVRMAIPHKGNMVSPVEGMMVKLQDFITQCNQEKENINVQ